MHNIRGKPLFKLQHNSLTVKHLKWNVGYFWLCCFGCGVLVWCFDVRCLKKSTFHMFGSYFRTLVVTFSSDFCFLPYNLLFSVSGSVFRMLVVILSSDFCFLPYNLLPYTSTSTSDDSYRITIDDSGPCCVPWYNSLCGLPNARHKFACC